MNGLETVDAVAKRNFQLALDLLASASEGEMGSHTPRGVDAHESLALIKEQSPRERALTFGTLRRRMVLYFGDCFKEAAAGQAHHIQCGVLF